MGVSGNFLVERFLSLQEMEVDDVGELMAKEGAAIIILVEKVKRSGVDWSGVEGVE